MWRRIKSIGVLPPRRYFQQWIASRIDRRTETQFNQRRIYIVPSKAGLGLLLLFSITILLGINFQNNLVFMVAFWLLAMLTINILFTYRNLSGLTLRAIHAEPCFAGEKALFWFEITEHQGRERPSIHVGWEQQDAVVINLKAHETLRISLSHGTQARGWLIPERLTVITRFPTGLARAWGYFLPDVKAIVYPKPQLLPDGSAQTGADPNQSKGREIPRGSHDFSGIRSYRSGDSMKQIHWPQFAKTGHLASREFVDYEQAAQWLDWTHWQGQSDERVLAHFTARVIGFHRDNTPWGMQIPDQRFEMDVGEAHRVQTLTALALYGVKVS